MKNIVTLKANYLADTMQSELMKKTIWSNVSIVSYNIPLIATLSICENISLPLQYFENVKRKEAEEIVKSRLQGIAKKVNDELPVGFGFVVLSFSFDKPGLMMYVSNADRKDIVQAMKEWIEKTENI